MIKSAPSPDRERQSRTHAQTPDRAYLHVSPFPVIVALFALLLPGRELIAAPRESLVFADRPAKRWDAEAFPVGNGRLGAMIFGGIQTDRIQFNDITLWTGDRNPAGNYDTHGDRPDFFGAYQNFGDITVDFTTAFPSPSNYRRTLNCSRGIVTTAFESGGSTFTREAFVSGPDDILVIRYAATRAGGCSGVIRLADAHGNRTSASGDTLAADGALKNGLLFGSRVKVLHDGGSVTAKDGALAFQNCDALTILVAARTNYVADAGKNWAGDPVPPRLEADLRRAAKPYARLRDDAERYFRGYMDRMTFDIGSSPPEVLAKTTAARLAAFRAGGKDPDLTEDYFNYGRYIALSCANGPVPANLQGLWCDSNTPPWAGDYHNDINIQMNYWGLEQVGFPEFQRTLIDYVLAQAPSARLGVIGDKTKFPRTPRGWTARTSQNIRGGMGWKWNDASSAWYMLHLWEHFAFTRDRRYLEKTAYPAMKEVCAFWEDYLKELSAGGANFREGVQTGEIGPNDEKFLRDDKALEPVRRIRAGTLVAPDGWSPEHGVEHEDGVAMTQQTVIDLFTNTIEAANLLGDTAYARKLSGLLARVDGPRIGRWGQIQEWLVDREEKDGVHRHTSQLFAVFPGRLITPEKTPELAEAARLTLRTRGAEKPGKPVDADTLGAPERSSWTWTWRSALWARLRDGERAGVMLRGLMSHNTYDNFVTNDPPFQIDGNLGILAGVAEMLIQSHDGEIVLLPAIPREWSEGSVSGLRARGGFVVDMQWKAGKITRAKIRSLAGEPIRLRAGIPVTVVSEGRPVATGDGVVVFATQRDKDYEIVPK